MITKKQKNSIKYEFIQWILSVEEDTPLPYETKNVYIIIDFSNNDIAISYSADERKFAIFDYGFFCPIDAQYFSCDTLKKIAKNVFCKNYKITTIEVLSTLHSIIFEATKNINFFNSYTIFIGERFKNLEL